MTTSAQAVGHSSLTPEQQSRDGVRRIALGLGDWRVSTDPEEELVCLGLGSCVALCVYDPVAHVAGMAHMVLPDSGAARPGSSGTKFVDIAIPTVMEHVTRLGGIGTRLRVSLVGGAHILAGAAFASMPQIGTRNVEAALAVLGTRRLKPDTQETGGTAGRTVRLSVLTGELRVETAGRSARTA